MKRIFLIASFVMAINSLTYSQACFGVQFGGVLAFAKTETGSNDDNSNKPRLGLVAGFLADIPIGPVSFRPEVNFIQKGFKNEADFLGTTFQYKERLNYVEVPLNVVYNLKLGEGTSKVFFGLGPNFAFGLSGKVKEDAGSGDVTTNDIKFDGNETDPANPNTVHYKRFDFGANILAGYQMGMGLTFNLGYTLGLSDISPNLPGNDNFTQKNHFVALKVGYLFGCGKTKSKSSSTTTGM